MRALRFASALTVAAGVAIALPALAGPPSGDLAIEAFPLFGSGATVAQGWSEVAVRVQNNGARAARGTVEVTMQQYGHARGRRAFRADAPFAVGGGASVHVRLPADVGPYGDLVVTTRSEEGAVLHETRFPAATANGLTMLEVSDVPHLRAVLQDAVVTPLAFVYAAGRSAGSWPQLSVALPRYDAATGDPILPDRAALYAAADVVVMRSDVLARLGGAELDALAGYVLAGGTLALVVTRPEDLRHPTTVALAGGPITRQGVSAATLADFVVPVPSTTLPPSAKVISGNAKPSGDVAETLSGFTGGNLRGSIYGSSAAYGLGEVHLLAFDPTRKPAVDDPWAQARMVDLARRAFDRRTTQVFRPGTEPPSAAYGRVRQQLDPNEGSRWAIAAAALLLCVYAVIAAPINFALAQKAQQPLRALRRLPIIAAVAFAMVVGIGVAAKGVNGRARHLTLVEAGAGMTKGSARRFRGFYASRARELTVRTSDGSSLVSTAVLPEYGEHKDHLVVDREGARLVEVAALPWQTVVVREDGFASLGEGIALVKDASGNITVVNRAGRDLRAAIVRAPTGEAYYFARIKEGEKVTTGAASALHATVAGAAWESTMQSAYRAGSIDVHRLASHELRRVLDGDAPGLADAWGAIDEVAIDTTDWFPDRVPTLIAQLDGGEGKASDSGLRLETDRLLVRVVGFGGRP